MLFKFFSTLLVFNSHKIVQFIIFIILLLFYVVIIIAHLKFTFQLINK